MKNKVIVTLFNAVSFSLYDVKNPKNILSHGITYEENGKIINVSAFDVKRIHVIIYEKE